MGPMEKEFFRMVLAKEGQEVVHRDGYVTIPATVAERFRKEKGLE